MNAAKTKILYGTFLRAHLKLTTYKTSKYFKLTTYETSKCCIYRFSFAYTIKFSSMILSYKLLFHTHGNGITAPSSTFL